MRRVITVAVAMGAAGLVAAIEASREWRHLGTGLADTDMLRIWGANLGASLAAAGILAIAFLMSRRSSLERLLFVLSVPLILFASMLPVYGAVRLGVPSEWQFVCPSEAQRYAAPLAVLIGSLVLPLARRWRGV